MNAKNAKEKLQAIIKKFKGDATTPVTTDASTPTPYTLQDGTAIVINQAGATPAVGDTVTVNGAAPTSASVTLADGTVINLDATGAIASIVAPVAAPAAPATPAPANTDPSTLTAEQAKAMYEKFAVGTPEDRIGNLETMVKALMECNFGWQIRQGQENQAIQTYKDTLATIQPAVTTAAEKMEAAEKKIGEQETKLAEQATTIEKYGKTIEDLFDLVEVLTNEPDGDPVTLTGSKKEKMERQENKYDKYERMAAAIKKNREAKAKA